MDGGAFHKLPEVAALAICAAQVTATEGRLLVAVAVAISRGRGVTDRSAADLGRDVGLPPRTAQADLYGQGGGVGLEARYLERTAQGLTWRRGLLDRFVRVGRDERDAMAQPTPLEVLQLWALCKLRMDGRKLCNRTTWSSREIVEELAELTGGAVRWLTNRAARALRGNGPRRGALARGLVRIVEGSRDLVLLARFPREEPTPAPAAAAPGSTPCSTPSSTPRSDPPLRTREIPGCASPRAREELWQISRSNNGDRVFLLDLLERRVKQGGFSVDSLEDRETAEDLTRWLEADRAWAPPGRRWAVREVAKLLPRVRERVAEFLEASTITARRERERWQGVVRAAAATIRGPIRQALEDLAGEDLTLDRAENRFERLTDEYHDDRYEGLPPLERCALDDAAREHLGDQMAGATEEAREQTLRHLAVRLLREADPVLSPYGFWSAVEAL